MQGDIIKILRDDIHIFSNRELPATFFSLFDAACQIKAKEFWNELVNTSTVLHRELNAIIGDRPEMFRFSGFVNREEIIINALQYNEALAPVSTAMVPINNEQQNLRLQMPLKVSDGPNGNTAGDVDFLDEMTGLNNELVNSQRTLVKKNAEITRLNHRLNEVNADLEQFTYVASHDLREPLRMVSGFMELLKMKYSTQLDDKANAYIGYALEGSQRMQTMIADLLDLSKIGRKNTVKAPVALQDVFLEVKGNLRQLLKDTGVLIIEKNQLPVLTVYRPDISRLLQNLLTNAIKFRKEGTHHLVQLNAVEQERSWLFIVEDNGIGIEPGKFKKIFEIFTRLHTPKSYEGSGIGLAICKKIVEQNGGEIWVESEIGIGTTFYFTLLK